LLICSSCVLLLQSTFQHTLHFTYRTLIPPLHPPSPFFFCFYFGPNAATQHESPPLPLCGAYPIEGYCGSFLNKPHTFGFAKMSHKIKLFLSLNSHVCVSSPETPRAPAAVSCVCGGGCGRLAPLESRGVRALRGRGAPQTTIIAYDDTST
jgi:hypothetical protein